LINFTINVECFPKYLEIKLQCLDITLAVLKYRNANQQQLVRYY
jgi:hypothetical protein